MSRHRAAVAALLLCAGTAQAQKATNCMSYPALEVPADVVLPDDFKFFAEIDPPDDAALPPTVKVVYTNVSAQARDHFVRHLEAGRWVCSQAPNPRLTQHWSVRSGTRTRFPHARITLADFLALMKEVPATGPAFNFDQLGCPFVVKWQQFRPAAPNRADMTHIYPRHKPFLSWLASLELDLPKEAQTKLIGESMDVAVPCVPADPASPAPAAGSKG